MRKYAGRLIAWVFLTIGLATAAMSHRSTNFSDTATWIGNGQGVCLLSSNGQFSIFTGPAHAHDGWSFGNGYPTADSPTPNYVPWQSDLGETIGFEANASPDLHYRGVRRWLHGVDPAQWVRVKWLTIAALFMIQPLVYVLRRLLAWRRAAADAAA